MSEGPVSIEQPQETSSFGVEKAITVEALKEEVGRLKFDTFKQVIPQRNFDPHTGEDLRNDETKRLSSIKDTMTRQAEGDMSTALGIREEARYSKYTGTQIPEKQLDENGTPTLDSLNSRIGVFRSDIGILVEQAGRGGVYIPRFDGQTGEAIPQDSLRAFQEANRRQSTQRSEIDEDMEDLNRGTKALADMKRIRREDEEARRRHGLPPRN